MRLCKIIDYQSNIVQLKITGVTFLQGSSHDTRHEMDAPPQIQHYSAYPLLNLQFLSSSNPTHLNVL